MIDTPKTAGQTKILDLARAAFEATCNAILRGEDPAMAEEGLTTALQGLKLATRLQGQLDEVPVDQQSPEARAFHKPPVDQVALQETLLAELAEARASKRVLYWYKTHRERIDQVQEPKLRNALYDAIRGS